MPKIDPFKVGEEILVENVAVGFGTTGKGYNSEDYGFKLFKVTSLDSNLGGSELCKLNMTLRMFL